MTTHFADTPVRSPRALKRALGLIFFVMLMDVVGLSILAPVAPYIVQRYSGNASTVTLLFVIYAGAQFLAAPALGHISDRVGRRPVLLLCVLGSALGYFIFGVGGALWLLFPLGFLQSAVTGFIWSATGTLAAGYASEREQGQLAGVNGALAGLMAMLGPLAAGAVYGLSVGAMLAAALLLVGWVKAAAPAQARAAAEA